MTRLRRILATLADCLQPRRECAHDEDCLWSDTGVGT